MITIIYTILAVLSVTFVGLLVYLLKVYRDVNHLARFQHERELDRVMQLEADCLEHRRVLQDLDTQALMEDFRD